jgi:hypothetical protein
MFNPIENQIKDRIAAFVTELDLLVRKNTLEVLQGMLAGGGSMSPRRGRPAGRGRKPGRPRGSGTASADASGAPEKVLAHVQANDGQGISTIAEATGLALKVAKKAAGSLLAAGQLAKSGQKRGTVYHVGSGKPARAGKPRRATKAKRGKRGKKRGRRPKAA